MKHSLLLFGVGLALGLGLLFALHRGGSGSSPRGGTLTVYCAAGMKQPIDALAARYRADPDAVLDALRALLVPPDA